MLDDVVQNPDTFELVDSWGIFSKLYLLPAPEITTGHWANLIVQVMGCLLFSIGSLWVGKEVINSHDTPTDTR
jgi:hypothetical protein